MKFCIKRECQCTDKKCAYFNYILKADKCPYMATNFDQIIKIVSDEELSLKEVLKKCQ